MPNIKGGKNFKKGRKKKDFTEKKNLLKKDEDELQEYAQVIGAKGNGRFELKCCDGGKERLGIVCGKMRKRVWINRGDLVLFCKWEDMSDDEVSNELCKIKGIGPWTADMFLIFRLGRTNILPLGDIGLVNAINLHYNNKVKLTKEELMKFKEKWSPWCSIATWYMWRSLDPVPVEY